MTNLRPAVALSRFRPEDRPRFCELDPGFEPNHEVWLRKSEAMIAALKVRGVEAVKMTLDPDSFVDWARANGHGTGQLARSTFTLHGYWRNGHRDTDYASPVIASARL